MGKRCFVIFTVVAASWMVHSGLAEEPAATPRTSARRAEASRPAAPALPRAGDQAIKVKPNLPKTASNRVVSVTVYPNSALVTREVAVPEGAGSFELVVASLPPQTVNSSLYSEGTDGIRVLTTRFRMRPIQEDTREEVRKLDAQLKRLHLASQKIQSEIKVIDQNQQTLSKLEGFTTATLQHLTDKGQLNGEATMALTKYIMETRGEKADALVALQQQSEANQEQMQFAQRQLQELTAGSNKTEREAIIIVDKKDKEAGTVRLNYLVDSANWHPQYKFRAGKEKEPIQVEYLAAIVQQTGEEWRNVDMILSTAEPMLNAVPPDLKVLNVAVVPQGTMAAGQPGAGQFGQTGGGGNPAGGPNNQMIIAQQSVLNAYGAKELAQQAKTLRGQARLEYKGNKDKAGGEFLNSAAALEQASDLLTTRDDEVKNKAPIPHASNGEGPSVTYHLQTKLSIPSRNDEQVIEVSKLEMVPDYFYKAVPILTPHVYRLANLTNKSEYVLLPGEATMYIGKDFVGRAHLPLVAIGEQFTAGFGVDPQLQVQRQLTDKVRSTQGDNQILKYEYRILMSSYKSEPVKVQVWDRLPQAETEAMGVNLVKAKPEISADPLYLRENRAHNLLRWDLTVDPLMNGEKALTVNYEFKLELGRQMVISNIAAK